MIEVIEWIDLVGLIAIAFLFVPPKPKTGRQRDAAP